MSLDSQADDGWIVALDALVQDVVGTQRKIAELQAQQAVLLAGAAELATERDLERQRGPRSRSDLGMREVAAELAAAMRLSDRTVQHRVGDAVVLTMRYARTLSAWWEGRIDSAHVAVIVEAGTVVGDEHVSEYEGLVLAIAECETAGRLRRWRGRSPHSSTPTPCASGNAAPSTDAACD